MKKMFTYIHLEEPSHSPKNSKVFEVKERYLIWMK